MVMDSIIVRTATRAILPLLLLFAVFLFLRGHNAPGGGFIGGLVAAAAIILLALAGGLRYAEAVFPIAQAQLTLALGLLIACLAAIIPLFLGQPLMTGLWPEITIPGLGEIGTPFIFDLGVFLVVVGMTLIVVLHLIEKVEQWKS